MKVVSRQQWGADPKSAGPQGIARPVGEVFLHHSVTATLPAGASVAQEQKAVKQIESIGMSRFGRASYSFLIFRSGRVYALQGWQRIGAHTANRNSTSYGICFVGNYETDKPTRGQLINAGLLVRRGIKRGHVRPAARVRFHSDVSATACPGRYIRAQVGLVRRSAFGSFVGVANRGEATFRNFFYNAKGAAEFTRKRISNGWRVVVGKR